jgi:hypothetical protein
LFQPGFLLFPALLEVSLGMRKLLGSDFVALAIICKNSFHSGAYTEYAENSKFAKYTENAVYAKYTEYSE